MNNDKQLEMNELIEEAVRFADSADAGGMKKRIKSMVLKRKCLVAMRNAATALVLLAIALTVGIKTSDVFAQMVKDIPVIGTVAAAIKPELKESIADIPEYIAAFQNGYEQDINQEVKAGNITLTLQNIISDEERLAMFFSLSDDDKNKTDGLYYILLDKITVNGSQYGMQSGIDWSSSEIRTDGKVIVFEIDWSRAKKEPEDEYQIYVTLNKTEDLPQSAYSESFVFDIKPKAPAAKTVFTPNEEIEHRGQTFSVASVDFNITCAYVKLRWKRDNTMELCGIRFSVVDENGEVIWKSDGKEKSSAHSDSHEDFVEYYYELSGDSFAEKDNLTLRIDRIDLLPQNMENIYYNTETKVFYDDYGELDYIKSIELTEEQKEWMDIFGEESTPYAAEPVYYVFNGDRGDGDYSVRNAFEYFLTFNDEYLYFMRHYSRGGSESAGFDEGIGEIGLWREYVTDENGIVHLGRNYPEYIDYPEITIQLN